MLQHSDLLIFAESICIELVAFSLHYLKIHIHLYVSLFKNLYIKKRFTAKIDIKYFSLLKTAKFAFKRKGERSKSEDVL